MKTAGMEDMTEVEVLTGMEVMTADVRSGVAFIHLKGYKQSLVKFIVP
jgi:hypothetical protein